MRKDMKVIAAIITPEEYDAVTEYVRGVGTYETRAGFATAALRDFISRHGIVVPVKKYTEGITEENNTDTDTERNIGY